MKRRGLGPPLLVATALLAHVALMYKAALRHTGGNVSFPVDDAFIHLALAKQLVTNGVYGVSPHEFASVSSSIVWPFLLALGMKIAGFGAWLPLVLNAALGVGLIFVVDRAVRILAPEAGAVARGLVALAVVVLTPLPTVVVLGMEHTGHALATIAFIALASRWLAEDDGQKTSRRTIVVLAVLAAATTSFRYEGAFPVALVFALSLVRKRGRDGALVAAGGALPLVLFGIYLKTHGAFFLPVPVLLKGRHFAILDDPSILADLLGGDLVERVTLEPHVGAAGAALGVAAFVAVKKDGLTSPLATSLLVALGMLVMHVELASLGWFYRYEAYLLAAAVTFVGAALARFLPAPRALGRALRGDPWAALAGALGVVLAVAPLARRAVQANGNTPLACRNIFHQQMQSALFLASHYRGERVAVNDIGAVAWVGNDRVTDLIGLATLPVAMAKGMKLERDMSMADLERLTRGVQIAIVYDEWFRDNLPPSWLRVGRWKIKDNRSCAFPTVAIYATDPESFPRAVEALRTFDAKLPRHIDREGRYADRPLEPALLRAGDRVSVAARPSEIAGAYVVAEDGTIAVRKVGDVPVRGFPPERGAAVMRDFIATERPAKAEGAEIVDVTRVGATNPSIHVMGAVARAGRVEGMSLTLDAAVAAAGGATRDPSRAYVWRETAAGFVRRTRDELTDGTLVDGDVVVVP